MNDFVNPKKRSIQLPKGFKDLSDVLKKKSLLASKDFPQTIGKCEYCDALGTAGSSSTAMFSPGESPKWQSSGWCIECARDLKEFWAKEENKFPEVSGDFDFTDAETMKALEQRMKEIEEREKEYMRHKVAQRKGPERSA